MTRVQNVVYLTDQMDRAVAFYRDVLGLKLIARDGAASAEFAAGDVTISLRDPKAARDHTGATVVLEVSDLESLIASLRHANCEVLSDRRTRGGRVTAIRDPAGNIVELVEEAATPLATRVPATAEFLSRLEALLAAFETSVQAVPAAYSETSVDLGHAITDATFRRMAAYVDEGATESDLIHAFALAIAFTANCVLNCSAVRGDGRVADVLFRTARDAARKLGDGADKRSPGRLPPSEFH
jgi:predicted enzyme related to lactoylglutathione lyase